MKVNAITMTAPAKTQKTPAAKNPQITNPIEKKSPEKTNNGSQAAMNYFLGMQNVPSFKGYPCSTSGFVVKQIEDVPCACCGAEMFNAKEQNEFVDKATKSKGEELSNLLSENLHKIRRNERPIARELMERATKFPEDNLSKLATKGTFDAAALVKKENLIVLDNVDKKAKEVYGEENKVSKFVGTQKTKGNFSRENFLKELTNLTKNDGEKSQKVLTEAIELPLSVGGVEKVAKKVQGADSIGIARRLISTAVMTTEHIHPKSKGGPNNTENYMGECAECNNNRGSQDLNSYWQATYPNMPSATQKYADFITEKIITGEMGTKYEDHMVDLEKAVETETRGAIDLKVLNPEEIDKARKERGLPDPQPRQEIERPVKADTKKGTKKPVKNENNDKQTQEVKNTGSKRKPKPSRRPRLHEAA